MLRTRTLQKVNRFFYLINIKTQQQRNQSLEKIPTTQDFYLERSTRGVKFVDKTQLIETLMRLQHGRKIFFTRPRKMGKSLTIEQMKLVALGNREAFGPLENNQQQFEIYNSEDLFMKRMPVLHLDLSLLDVHDPITGIARELRNSFAQNRLEVPEVIETEFRKKTSVVEMITLTVRYFASQSESGQIIILIDEYDSPITKAIAENMTDVGNILLARKNRDLLRAFFSPLKGLGSMIHLLFITGVSKFSYTNLFSSMNDLEDLSADISLSTLTGYTLEEVKNTYPNAYGELLRIYGTNLDERIIKEYNGFRFCAATKDGLLNPWDINQLLKKQMFENFWATRGRPMHLWSLFNPTVHNILEIIEPQEVKGFDQSIDLDELVKPSTRTLQKLFYETGYLTIKDNKLTVPNNSVRETLISDLSQQLELLDNNDIIIKMKEALMKEDMDQLFQQLGRLIKSFPHPIFRTISNREIHAGKIEAVYAVALYVSLLHLKQYFPHMVFLSEGSTSNGNLDLFIRLKKSMHIIEFKVVQDESKNSVGALVKKAFKQMKEKNYAHHHLVLQSSSELKLYLSTFVYDIEEKKFVKAKTIAADACATEIQVEEFTPE